MTRTRCSHEIVHNGPRRRGAWMGLALFVLLAVPTLHGQELLLKHYTTQNEINPLPKPAVTDVYQDRAGFIWIANYGMGLVRYDGQRMETYGEADGLSNPDVFGVVQDGAGRLWVASSTLNVSEMPLDAYAPGSRVRFVSAIGETPVYGKPTPFPLNTLDVDRAGHVWFGTVEDGLVRYRTDAAGALVVDTLATGAAPGAANVRVIALTARRDGSVWVSLRDGRLVAFSEAGDVLHDVEAARLPCSAADVLYEDSAGALWGTCAGHPAWRMTASGTRGEAFHFDTVGPAHAGLFTSILEVAPGTVWIAGLEMGITEVTPASPDRHTVYTRLNGLLDANIWAMLRDREGNLWLAQNNGLSRLPANYGAFQFYTSVSHAGEPPVLPAPGANALLPDFTFGGAGRDTTAMLAVATTSGIAFVRPNGVSENVNSAQGLWSDVILSLCTDSERRLWVGTRQGMSVLARPDAPLPPGSSAPRRLSVFGQPLQLANYEAASINTCGTLSLPVEEGAAARGEAVCFASNPGLRCLVGGRWFFFGTAAGLPPGDFWAARADDAGHVYVGSKTAGLHRSTRPLSLELMQAWASTSPAFGGVIRVTEPLFAAVRDSAAADLLSGGVSALSWTDGVLWANTDSGVVVLEGSPLRVTTRFSGERSNLTSITRSPTSGNLWAGGGQGIIEIDPTTRTIVRRITKQNGLLGDETWGPDAIAVGADGTVYHGSSLGVTVYHPGRDGTNKAVPLLAFRGIEFRQGNRGNNEVSLQYAALSFASEKLVRYRTRLVGYDADWSPETEQTSIRYTNLPAFFVARKYTFEVLAANNDGVWTEAPLQHAFSVMPPWWLRWWAFLIYGALLAAGVFVVDRLQRRRLLTKERERVRERELEQAREIERAYHELEHTHTRLKATQAQLVQQEKLASLGALTAGIAHEIKNPLNFVNNFAQLTGELVQELRGESVQHPETRLVDVDDVLADLELNAAKIAEHGRRADGIIRGMLAHARGSTGHREAIDLNTLADEYATLAYHGARAQRPDVQVQVERDFDPAVGRVELLTQEMSRVLLNLLSNAFYAVHARAAQQNGRPYVPTVRVVTRRHPDGIEVRVEDNGTGIPEDVRARIFEPFFTTKPTGEGTGLGLSLSYEIVQAHGGTLSVESQAGEGTSFRIHLPSSPALTPEVSP